MLYLQGLARDEAAEQLGTTVGAVRGQLERGRNLLERRLARRGVVLSAGLLAVLMGSSRSAGGSPVELIELAVRAVGGSASPAVAALTTGAFPMTTTLKRILLPAVLALGLLGAGVGFTPHVPLANADDKKPTQDKMEKPKADTKGDTKNPEAKERTITGTVLGYDGKPVAAELQLLWQDSKPLPLGKTKADGTFKVTVPMRQGEWGGWLVAKAAGHGMDFVAHGMTHSPRTITPTLDVTLKLPKERPIKGRILDQQGKPVAGATVKATTFSMCDTAATVDARLKRWATETFLHGIPPDGDRSLYFSDKYYADKSPDARTPYTATADKDGRFEIAGAGAGQLVHLRIRGTEVADTEVITLNRDGFDPEPTNKLVREHEFRMYGGKWRLVGPDPAVVLEPEKIVRGTVTDHQGKPRAGVQVVLSRVNKRDLNSDHNVAATDKDGKYVIRGARKHTSYMVEVQPDVTTGLLPCQGSVDDTVGYEPIVIDLKCAKGVVITGTVTNKETREPVHTLMYAQVMVNNPFVEKYPPFMNGAGLGSDAFYTDKAGRYRIVTIPGPVVLSAAPRGTTANGGRTEFKPLVPDPKYADHFHPTEGALTFDSYGGGQGFVQGDWCKVIDAKEADTELTVNVELEPATKTVVKVIDPDGKPVTSGRATGVTHVEFSYPAEFTDALTVFNLEPKKGRVLAVVHKERKLVGTLTLTADTKDPLVKVGSGGSVTGRVVDESGQPAEGVMVKLHFERREVAEAFAVVAPTAPVTTDAKGNFRFDTLPPGWKFRFTFTKGVKRFGPDYQKATRYEVDKNGETKDVGDQKLEPTKDGE